jgi:DNA replication protein DnaC
VSLRKERRWYGVLPNTDSNAESRSKVFGPASLCFNAASLLLDIPRQVKDFYDLVDSIFEEVSRFLYQFKIYQRIEQFTRIEPDLSNTVHDLMISFVDLCALSIKVNRGGFWKRLGKSAKKVLMDDDAGIGKELARFRSLSEKQSALQETLTLEQVLKTDKKLTLVLNTASDNNQKISEVMRGVEFLTSAEKDRKLEQMAKEQRDKIIKKLPVRKEAVQVSETRYIEVWDDTVQKTGDWLHENSDYVGWADGQPDSNPLLLLTGDPNTGKSYLVSAIIHDLQAAPRSQGPNRRKLAVAYYFFPKWAEKAQKSSQEPRPAEIALKCMSLQIADGDATYAKLMATFCDSKDEAYFKDLTCTDLWRDLKFVGTKRDTTYFLLFDGLDQVPEESRHELLKILAELRRLPETERAQIRALMSGKPETFPSDISQSPPTINIEEENKAEIRRYIERKLKGDNILQESDALRKQVLDELSDLGNFFKVQSALGKISAKIDDDGDTDDVRRILSEAGQDSAVIARNIKDELGELLSAKEIEELNELLVWVIYGFDFLSVGQLQAALVSPPLCYPGDGQAGQLVASNLL